MELQEAFTNLTEKFISGNSIPVERNTITRAEWEPICAVIAEALKPSHNIPVTEIALLEKALSRIACNWQSNDCNFVYDTINAVIAQLRNR